MTIASISSSSVNPAGPPRGSERLAIFVCLAAIANIIDELAGARHVFVPNDAQDDTPDRRQVGVFDLTFPIKAGIIGELAATRARIGKLLDQLHFRDELPRQQSRLGQVLIT